MHIPTPSNLDELAALIRGFAKERDWDQFHTPKNLAMGVAIEAAELMEEFHWLTPEESGQIPPEKLAPVRHEMADVLLYLVRLADKLVPDRGRGKIAIMPQVSRRHGARQGKEI
jgi:NTP pyrophosphatase (non-canonical NTP hydrolase)